MDLMKRRWAKHAVFLAESIVLGLAMAFVLVWFRPDLLQAPGQEFRSGRPGVEQDSFADGISASIPAVVNVYTLRVVSRTPLPTLILEANQQGLGRAWT